MKKLLFAIAVIIGVTAPYAQSVTSGRTLFAPPLPPGQSQRFSSAPSLLPSCADSSQWSRLTPAERRETLGAAFRAEMADECFYDMVTGLFFADRKLLEDSLSVVFSSRAGKGRFSLPLFLSLYNTGRIARNRRLWARIAELWSASSDPPPYAVLAEHGSGGKLPVADTLYGALDAAGMVDAHELLRYGRVKCLLGDYKAASGLFCRAIENDRRVEHAAMSQLEQLFADADSAVKADALGNFMKCVFALQSIDTAYFRNRAADFCNRQGLFEREIAVLTEFDVPSAPSGRRLAETARSHFSQRRYRHAVNAAVAADNRLDSADKPGNAFILYQAYMNLGVKDSALAWLSASGVSNKDTRSQTIVLHQETGRARDAAALIDSLPSSLQKDTLTVRQRFFTGELGRALEHTSAPMASWAMNSRERMFWQVRALIFNGRPGDAASVLDSLRFASAWHGASEILRYKYWMQKLEDDPGALGVWGKLEYYIYIGDLTAAAELLKKRGLAGEAGEMMAVRLSRPLARSGRAAEALQILELVDGGGSAGAGKLKADDKGIPDLGIKGIPGREENSGKDGKTGKGARTPEYLYFKAELLNETSRRDEARAIAQNILRDFPGDVFAQKARILLMKI